MAGLVGSLTPTFLASLRAVGTAATMAFAGFYLHRRSFVTPSGKKMMALLSQQVTIPAFLFAKIIYCPNRDTEAVQPIDNDDGVICPTVASRISDLWMLVIWPFYVVSAGLLVGYFAAKVSGCPARQVNSCLAACAFGNSTGLPITLLSVIHKQFRSSTELGRIDPTAFLSVYLLLYPVLQWGAGGYILAPDERVEGKVETKAQPGDDRGMTEPPNPTDDLGKTVQAGNSQNSLYHKRSKTLDHVHISHLLNRMPMNHYSAAVASGDEEFGGMSRNNSFLYRPRNERVSKEELNLRQSRNSLTNLVSELSFLSLTKSSSFAVSPAPKRNVRRNGGNGANGEHVGLLENGSHESYNQLVSIDAVEENNQPVTIDAVEENAATAAANMLAASLDPLVTYGASPDGFSMCSGQDADLPQIADKDLNDIQEVDLLPLTETLVRVALKVFQPPVIGALAGLIIASFPRLRGVLENIYGDDVKTAPLKWLFDGIYSVGQAAVPINMTILGINLSSTFQKKKSKPDSVILPNSTMASVVVGKMVIMPLIGVFSTWFLQKYYIDIPDEIDSTVFLVMMIVFICPTANNVMVMVELSGSGSKEGMARLIGWQYFVSPVVLSFVLAAVVHIATALDKQNKL